MAKSVDWAKLGWCMTQAVKVGADSTSMFANGKARYGAFKTASDSILGKHTAAVSRAASIDFDHYKKALPAQSAWISDMEKQYAATMSSIKAPADTLSDSIAADDSVFEEIASSSVAALDSAASEAQAEFNKLSSLPPPMQMTDSDIYNVYPELNPFSVEQQVAHDGSPQWVPEEQKMAREADMSARRQKIKGMYFE